MCIRDSSCGNGHNRWSANSLSIKNIKESQRAIKGGNQTGCLLYTSDAADERSSVDLGGRRIIKKKNKE